MEGDGFISQLTQKANFKDVNAFFSSLRKREFVVIEKDIQHPKFQTFLQKTKSFIPRMCALQLCNIATCILYNKPLQQHQIAGKIQDALVMKMQELPIKRILQLDFIIRKSKSTDLFEAIQLKIQEVFLGKVGHFLCNHHNHIVTIDNIAGYMNHHTEIVSLDLLKDFSNVLLSIADYRIKSDSDMLSIIKMFSKFRELDEQSKNALKKMVNIWINLNLTTNSVEMMLSLISESEQIDKGAFEEAGFIRMVHLQLFGWKL